MKLWGAVALPVVLWAISMSSGASEKRSCSDGIHEDPRKLYAPMLPTSVAREICDRPVLAPVFEYTVLADGHVGKIKLLKSSGCVAVDDEVERCLSEWRFEPATCSGEPVGVKRGFTVNWGYGKFDGVSALDYCRPYELREKEAESSCDARVESSPPS